MSLTNPKLIDAVLALVPGAQVTINGEDITWNDPPVAPVTMEQIQSELVTLQNNVPLIECKSQAQQLLQATDWTQLPDVSDTARTPHLLNLADFITYRSQLRTLAVNPVANPVFPTVPTEQWSS